MENKYKIMISNHNLYKETELPEDAKIYRVGTSVDCDFRLHKDLFFEEIRLVFTNNNGTWSVMCADNLYLTVGDTRRLLTKELKHGDTIFIKYQDSNHDVFCLDFMIDFDSRRRNFERKIQINDLEKLSIGAGKENNIVLKSKYIRNDKIELIRSKDGLVLNIINVSYGVYHNGNKAENRELIKNGDFISVSDFMFYYKNSALWTDITENCLINDLSYKDYLVQNNYPKFVRNSRIKMVLNEEDIEILDPPTKPQKPKNNLLMNLLPAMGMLMATAVMAFMGGAMIIFSIVSGGMAIVTSIIGVIQGKREYKKDVQERIEKYNLYIEKKKKEIEKYRDEEREILNKIYIPKQESVRELAGFSSSLFERRKEDDDFLDVRLGTGKVEAVRRINYKKQEKLEIEDDLQVFPQRICEEYQMVENAPVVCKLREMNAIGIVGNESYRYELMKTIVLDITARQFYSDVKLFFIMEEEHGALVNHFRFLPHVDGVMNGTKNIVCDEESKKLVFEYLYNIFTDREQREEYGEHYIIFFYDQCGFASHPISRFVDKAKEIGVTFVFFGDEKGQIPLGCDRMIFCVDDRRAELINNADISDTVVFQYDTCTDREINRVAQIMTAVETEEISLEGSLTKNINLFALLNILGVEDLDLKKRWDSTKAYQSMAVPLGVSKTGVVYLDLHDKAHGPHGLVAGTTGAGKSEILQTYILSVATYFHPYEVAFVIIDFKGGGMVNQFKELPHLLGAITNIDGKEIDRSLKSIRAELQKRQKLFADAEVNHIDKYIKKYKAGEVVTPLPHLIIIVDEFAELKAEQPEFMKELISAARIGRSLGVHLILATQKPAGQVDDQIWSNSRFKLCLKVQGPEDSNEVLKSPLAAEIKEPGRAYLQVGNNEIFELFQSAYSGAGEKAVDNSLKEFKIAKLDRSGKRTIIFEQKKKKEDSAGKTQLEAIVEYVEAYCKKAGIEHLSNICLESLQERILFSEEEFNKHKMFDIGIYDDPDHQYQGKTGLDLDSKNTLIIGSSQHGKTNLLQLLIREIALKYSPAQANIYILDFASMVLQGFDSLPHVGGVVCSSEDEKLKNLFKLLQEEIVIRKEKLVSVGVSSFTAYCEAGNRDLPHIYIFVDNMTALIELYLENDDTFLGIVREGLAVGISVILANAHTSGIGYKYLANFANKVALYCNDSNEYSNIFDHITLKPEELPGRCVIELEKRILECQTYLAFQGETEYERANDMKEFIKRCSQAYPGKGAKRIPFIPAMLTTRTLEENFGAESSGYCLPMGLSYNEVTPFRMDFAVLGAMGLCGKEKKGHYNFISSVLRRLNQNRQQSPVRVTIIDDVTRKYKDLSQMEIVESYSLDPEIVIEKLTEWHEILEERYFAMMQEQKPADNTLLMMIIQNNDAAKKIQEDMDALSHYSDIVTRLKALNVSIIFSDFVNAMVSYDAPEPIRMIKQEQHIICFDDLDNLKVFDVPYEELKANKKRLQLGDAYYIKDNAVTKVKLVKDEG